MVDDLYKNYRVNIKFISNRWVDSFVNDGLLFMNNVRYFREYEDDDIALRGDIHEGLEATFNADSLDLYFDGIKFDAVGKVDVRYNHQDETNIFCLTSISDEHVLNSKNQELYLSSEFEKFGNKAVIITNPTEFSKRIKASLDESSDIYSIEPSGNFVAHVNYVSRNKHHGKIGIFTKFDDYSWQHEWRIAFKQKNNVGPYTLKIGNISDITQVCDTKELLKQPIKIVTK